MYGPNLKQVMMMEGLRKMISQAWRIDFVTRSVERGWASSETVARQDIASVRRVERAVQSPERRVRAHGERA